MNPHEEKEDASQSDLLTDFGGVLNARLEKVDDDYIQLERYRSRRLIATCIAEFSPSVMRELSAGMIFSIPNFAGSEGVASFSLFELVDYRPLHFGALGLGQDVPPALKLEILSNAQDDWRQGAESAGLVLLGERVNYDLVITGTDYNFLPGWNFPVIGGKVRFLTERALTAFINGNLPNDAPVVGTLRSNKRVEVKVDSRLLAEHHVGVFAYTGGGKSNLVSQIIRTVIREDPSSKILIFDAAGEYVVNLIDLMLDEQIGATLLVDEDIRDPESLARRFAHPARFSSDGFSNARVKLAKILLESGRVKRAFDTTALPRFASETVLYRDVFSIIQEKVDYYSSERGRNTASKVLLVNCMNLLSVFLKERHLDFDSPVGQEIRSYIELISQNSANKAVGYLVSDLSEVALAAMNMQSVEVPSGHGLPDSELLSILGEVGGSRLIIASFFDLTRLRHLAASLCNRTIRRRKSHFIKVPRLLFVFDEAQEMIPKEPHDEDGTRSSSLAVEQLLRQGRKYGLGGIVATQRLAFLNTNVLQQIHTYFVGVLPRPYDRSTISEQFAIDPSIVDKTLELKVGQWLLSSYGATGVHALPLFIQAADNELTVIESLNKMQG